ncbi:MAG: hypothetical protein VKP62_13795 [Candidatus Sericytochromatia bacterium]|nr:hypothetical protein [Candidatus Sericytochromatia bacterium]
MEPPTAYTEKMLPALFATPPLDVLVAAAGDGIVASSRASGP